MDKKNIANFSIKELRGICQATAPDPATESYMGRFCRIFSIYTTRAFLFTPITSNQITVLSVLVFFVGIGMFFFGTYDFNLFAILLIWLSIVFDGSDGEVVRFRNKFEPEKKKSRIGGVYTEPLSHDIQYGFSFFIMGIAFYLNTGHWIYLILGAAASIFKLEYRLLESRFFATLKFLQGGSVMAENNSVKIAGEKFVVSIFSYINRNLLSSTGFLLSVFFFVIIDRIEWSLWFYAVAHGLFSMAVFARQIVVIIKNKY